MQVQRFDFSPGCASNGSSPPLGQRTDGAVIQAQSLMVEPPSQRVNNHGYVIHPPSPPPGLGTPTGAP
eukprot:4930399-Prorocentrum_lima.AAC.1